MTLEADGRHVRSEDLRKEITVLFDKCCGPQDTESPMQRLQIPGVFETHVADLGTVSHDCRYYMPQTHRHKHRRRQTTPLYITLHSTWNAIESAILHPILTQFRSWTMSSRQAKHSETWTKFWNSTSATPVLSRV